MRNKKKVYLIALLIMLVSILPIGVQNQKLLGSIQVCAAGTSNSELKEKVDNSAKSEWFPEIGNQGSASSCTSWAVTYYQFSYMINRELNIQNESDKLVFSPNFTYNLYNLGSAKVGALQEAPMSILQIVGVSPDVVIEEDEYQRDYRKKIYEHDAYKKAMLYRVKDYYRVPVGDGIDGPQAEGLKELKTRLSNGEVLNCEVKTDTFSHKTGKLSDGNEVEVITYGDKPNHDLFKMIKDYVYYQDLNDTGHLMTIVGYDDNVWVDYNNDKIKQQNELGAVKLVNSWGKDSGAEWMCEDGGCWVSYRALNGDVLTRITGMDVEVYTEDEFFNGAHNYIELDMNMGDLTSVNSQFTLYTDVANTIYKHPIFMNGPDSKEVTGLLGNNLKIYYDLDALAKYAGQGSVKNGVYSHSANFEVSGDAYINQIRYHKSDGTEVIIAKNEMLNDGEKISFPLNNSSNERVHQELYVVGKDARILSEHATGTTTPGDQRPGVPMTKVGNDSYMKFDYISTTENTTFRLFVDGTVTKEFALNQGDGVYEYRDGKVSKVGEIEEKKSSKIVYYTDGYAKIGYKIGNGSWQTVGNQNNQDSMPGIGMSTIGSNYYKTFDTTQDVRVKFFDADTGWTKEYLVSGDGEFYFPQENRKDLSERTRVEWIKKEPTPTPTPVLGQKDVVELTNNMKRTAATAGQDVVFEAKSNIKNVEYQFLINDKKVQDYSDKAVFKWNAVHSYTPYTITVNAKNESTGKVCSDEMEVMVNQKPVLPGSLYKSIESGNAKIGDTIQFNFSGLYGTGKLYKTLYTEKGNSIEYVANCVTTEKYITWTPKEAGTYTIGYMVSDENGIEALKKIEYVVKDRGNEAVIYYNNSSWSKANIHYAVNGTWTTVPGKGMSATTEQSGYTWKYVVDLGDLNEATLCFNNGNGNWDSKNGSNYRVQAGTYGIKNGVVTKLLGAATPTPTSKPTATPTSKPTATPTPKLSVSITTDKVSPQKIGEKIQIIGKSINENYDYRSQHMLTVYKNGKVVAGGDNFHKLEAGTTDTYKLEWTPTEAGTYTIEFKTVEYQGRTAVTTISYVVEDKTSNVAVIYYNNSSYSSANIHYCVGNGAWTAVPGKAMKATQEQSGYKWKYEINLGTATGATVCFNENGNNWDSKNGSNYQVQAGTYGIKNGTITKLSGAATPTPTSKPTATPTSKPTATPTPKLSVSITTDKVSPQKIGEKIQIIGKSINENYDYRSQHMLTVYKNGKVVAGGDNFHKLEAGTTDTYKLEWTPTEAGTYTIEFKTVEYQGRTAVTTISYVVEDKTSNVAVIYYNNSSYSSANIHYCVGNGAWTAVPGKAMKATQEQSGYKWKYEIDLGTATSATVCFNENGNNWDSRNGSNYTVKAGTYGISNGTVTTIN